jgi:hypothetical protein
VNRIRELPQNSKIIATHTDSPDVLIWDVEAQPNRQAQLAQMESRPDLVPPDSRPDLVSFLIFILNLYHFEKLKLQLHLVYLHTSPKKLCYGIIEYIERFSSFIVRVPFSHLWLSSLNCFDRY